MSTAYPSVKPRTVVAWTAACFGVMFAIFAILMLIILGIGSYSRWNARQEAHNSVKVSTIEIQNQAQRVQIAKQQADIRVQDAVGVRGAQDEIAKTLTPLYVQYEMVQALQAIATSGKNNSIVYVPAGANGIPLVSTVNPSQVGSPDVSK
jgi:hypothetical protein